MKKRVSALIAAALILMSSIPVFALEGKSARILFTHDIHSHLENATRLGTAIAGERSDAGRGNVILLDGGDFSQGTLYQIGYEEHALELGLLGFLGYSAVTIGNHEWDHGGYGFANMLRSSISRCETLPAMLCANLDFSGNITDEQSEVRQALSEYNQLADSVNNSYTILETESGLKIGVFGVSGPDSIDSSSLSNMEWIDYIKSSKTICGLIKDKCDVIVCLSHSASDCSGAAEDVKLATEVTDIDLIISAHSHDVLEDPIVVGDTVIVAVGKNLVQLGAIDVSVNDSGDVSFDNYRLIELAGLDENTNITKYMNNCDHIVRTSYLEKYGFESPQQVIAYSDHDFMNEKEMMADNQEFDIGNLIADSYLYTARKNGITDIDLAIVGLGTIRDTLSKGPVTVEDAFDVCSLGIGEDGTSGHPLVASYLTGKEIKLLAELDASLGSSVESIRMSYSGLRFGFNTKRMILNRVTNIQLYDEFGILGERKLENDKLYKVCCNMYALNMLGMVNGLTKGVLSITPKDADGNVINSENFYDYQMTGKDGEAIKEWVAFADYLTYLENIPDVYSKAQGRKTVSEAGDLESRLENPGLATWILIAAIVIALIIIRLIFKAVGSLFSEKSHRC